MFGQVPDQTLYRFVLHQTDANEAGVLQTRGEEMDSANHSVEELHVHLSEVVLAKLPREPLKTDQRLDALRAQRSRHGIQYRLPSRIAGLPRAPKNFQRRQIGLFFQDGYDDFPEIRNEARSADPTLLALGDIIDMYNRSFFGNAVDRTQGRAGQSGHFGLRVTSLQQDFDFVSF